MSGKGVSTSVYINYKTVVKKKKKKEKRNLEPGHTDRCIDIIYYVLWSSSVQLLDTLWRMAFENFVGKQEIVGNHKFLIFQFSFYLSKNNNVIKVVNCILL